MFNKYTIRFGRFTKTWLKIVRNIYKIHKNVSYPVLLIDTNQFLFLPFARMFQRFQFLLVFIDCSFWGGFMFIQYLIYFLGVFSVAFLAFNCLFVDDLFPTFSCLEIYIKTENQVCKSLIYKITKNDYQLHHTNSNTCMDVFLISCNWMSIHENSMLKGSK